MKDSPVGLAYSYNQYETFSQLLSVRSLPDIEMVIIFLLFEVRVKNISMEEVHRFSNLSSKISPSLWLFSLISHIINKPSQNPVIICL